MTENLVVEEVMGYFRLERSRLEDEIQDKEKKLRKSMNTSPGALPSFLDGLLRAKPEKLKAEIVILRQRLDQFSQAESDLKNGVYDSAIPLIEQIADRFIHPLVSFPNPDNAAINQIPNPAFSHLMKLMKEIVSLRDRKKTIQVAPI